MNGEGAMPYNDMTDRELIIKLYSKMDQLTDDIAELKQTLKDRPCPAALCREHEKILESHNDRILTLETYVKIVVGTVALIITALGAFIVDLVF